MQLTTLQSRLKALNALEGTRRLSEAEQVEVAEVRLAIARHPENAIGLIPHLRAEAASIVCQAEAQDRELSPLEQEHLAAIKSEILAERRVPTRGTGHELAQIAEVRHHARIAQRVSPATPSLVGRGPRLSAAEARAWLDAHEAGARGPAVPARGPTGRRAAALAEAGRCVVATAFHAPIVKVSIDPSPATTLSPGSSNPAIQLAGCRALALAQIADPDGIGPAEWAFVLAESSHQHGADGHAWARAYGADAERVLMRQWAAVTALAAVLERTGELRGDAVLAVLGRARRAALASYLPSPASTPGALTL